MIGVKDVFDVNQGSKTQVWKYWLGGVFTLVVREYCLKQDHQRWRYITVNHLMGIKPSDSIKTDLNKVINWIGLDWIGLNTKIKYS